MPPPPWLRPIRFLLAQLVPLAGVAIAKDYVLAHPLRTLAAIAAYEALAFVFSFGRAVWHKLEEPLITHTVEAITRLVQGFAPRFRGKLHRAIVNEHSILNVRGLNLINAFALQLEQVFVHLRIATAVSPTHSSSLLPVADAPDSQPIWTFLATLTAAPRDTAPRALTIIGAPGSGKTTLLQHVALMFASGRHRRYGLPRTTPLLLYLRDHAQIIVESRPTVADLAERHFGTARLYPGLTPPRAWFSKCIDSGDAIVLLDGLDEVTDRDQRLQVSQWVDDQIRAHPRATFVVTARPQGYREAPLQRSRLLEVQPFSAEQVRAFINNWYLANETNTSAPNIPLEEIHRRAAVGAMDLLGRLRMAPALGALTVNPLLLTMIAMVHRYRGALPKSRSELYGEIAEVLLSRWRQAKGLTDTLTSAQMVLVLKNLASAMMEARIRDIATTGVLPIIEPALERVGFTEGGERFLSAIQHNSGLLVEREASRWSFAHLTFQEYLAASSMVTGPAKVERPWSELVRDGWWHETLRLYSALGDATAILEACLQVDTIEALALAADCVNEAREADPSITAAVLNRVVADLNSPLAPRRRLAAEVHLSRRLKTLQRIEDGRDIDVRPLSWAEYELFIQDVPDGARLPDHLSLETARLLEPTGTAAGARVTDVLAFCEWLSRRAGTAARFRIPTVEESRSFPLVEPGMAWATGGLGPELVPEFTDDAAVQELARHSLLPTPRRDALANMLGMDVTASVAVVVGALDRDLDFNLARALDVSVTVARTIAMDARKVLYSIIARPAAPELSAQLRNSARFVGVYLSRYLKRALGRDKDLVEAALQANIWHEALAELEALPVATLPLQRAVRLLRSMIVAAAAGKHHRRAYARRYIATLLELCVLGEIEEELLTAGGLWGRLTQKVVRSSNTLSCVTELHWWLHITAARELGTVPAWEGVRVLREYGAAFSNR